MVGELLSHPLRRAGRGDSGEAWRNQSGEVRELCLVLGPEDTNMASLPDAVRVSRCQPGTFRCWRPSSSSQGLSGRASPKLSPGSLKMLSR